MLLPAIQAARESARRANCASNLKQFGIAIQTYADRNAEQIVPSSVSVSSNNGLSWIVLLYPVMEKANEFAQLSSDLSVDAGADTVRAVTFKDTSDIYRCPTRGYRMNGTATYGGPCVDYVCVGLVLDTSESSIPEGVHKTNGGMGSYRTECAQWYNGTLIPSVKVNAAARSAPSRLTIGGVTDGLTYTAVLGEKHLNPNRLGQAGYDNPYHPGHVTSGYGGGSKIASLGLAASPTDPAFEVTLENANGSGAQDVDYYRFGSWHPGITQFLFGDTRVAAVKNYADRAALYSMSHRGDGQPYNLP